jgi:hypothetical protein
MSTDEWPTPVLYIGGAGGAGSPMLAHVLGEVPGFVSVGEVRLLWRHGVVEDQLCGCGTRFSRCPFWVDVLDVTLGPAPAAQRVALAARWHSELERRTRVRSLPHHLRGPAAGGGTGGEPVFDEVADVLERLYSAIATVSGADVVVDCSKRPTYAALLHDLTELDVRVAHCLRDPRAAAFSARRRAALPPPVGGRGSTERVDAGRSALRWAVWNRALEQLGEHRLRSYARVTYEEFLDDPQGVCEHLLDVLDLPGDLRSVFAAPGIVRVGVQHRVSASRQPPMHGLVALAPDQEWRQRMTATDRSTVSALTWPTLRRYGYRLRG